MRILSCSRHQLGHVPKSDLEIVGKCIRGNFQPFKDTLVQPSRKILKRKQTNQAQFFLAEIDTIYTRMDRMVLINVPIVSAMCFEHMCGCLGGALVDVMLCCCLRFGTLNIHCLYPLVFRESWTCAISFLRPSGRVTMTSARLMSVRTTDLLCWRLKFKYWSVCVSLRYTMTCVLPSSLMFTHASRKRNVTSCSGSVVNLML